ncbi:hypothetical protein BD413DRAFT_528019, partial [Trametes elegans]
MVAVFASVVEWLLPLTLRSSCWLPSVDDTVRANWNNHSPESNIAVCMRRPDPRPSRVRFIGCWCFSLFERMMRSAAHEGSNERPLKTQGPACQSIAVVVGVCTKLGRVC